MRRGSTGALLAGAVALLAAGCGRPAGVDGNLTDDWPPMPEARVPVPADHACFRLRGSLEESFVNPGDSTPCTSAHDVVTFHVGTFAAADAARTSPPVAGMPGLRTAYEECASSARTFLGDDWRTGRLQLVVTPPLPKHWEAGARWFRCDLIAYRQLHDAQHNEEQPTASLRDSLTGARPYGLGCMKITVANDAVQSMLPADCTSPHNGEFAGVFEAPDVAYPSDQKARDAIVNPGCLATIAKYAAIPNDATLKYRTGYITSGVGAQEWALGDRGTRCYIWRSDRTFTRSLKGAGAAALPVR